MKVVVLLPKDDNLMADNCEVKKIPNNDDDDDDL